MSPLKKIAVAALASVALTGGAFAADAVGYVAPAAPVVSYDDNQFDWNRFYAGVYGVGQDYNNNWEYGVGVNAGVNAQFDFFLLGGEVAVHALTDGPTGRVYGQVLARGGLVVTDEVLVYAAGGYGIDFSSSPDEHWLLGGGLEYAVTDDISIRGQYLHGFAQTGTDTDQISVGVNFHF